MQPPPPPNLEAIREVVQELYEPSLRQVVHLEFYNPYPKAIDRENLTQGGIEFLNSLYSLEKMDNLPWSMWPYS